MDETRKKCSRIAQVKFYKLKTINDCISYCNRVIGSQLNIWHTVDCSILIAVDSKPCPNSPFLLTVITFDEKFNYNQITFKTLHKIKLISKQLNNDQDQ